MQNMKKAWITTAHQGFCESDMRSNTMSAFYLAAKYGADMIETDARKTADGVLIANHDPVVVGTDEGGSPVSYEIAATDYETIRRVILSKDSFGVQRVPTLERVLQFAYCSGLLVNVDLKKGLQDAEAVALLAARCGMKGRVVYAPNGSGEQTINRILKIDPNARFIDRPCNFTRELLKDVRDYDAKCYAYTADFSEENIGSIRENNVMLAAISLTAETAPKAFRLQPDMMEYLHTSRFFEIEKKLLEDSLNPEALFSEQAECQRI